MPLLLVARILVVLLGLSGAALAIHIHRKKKASQVLVCPLHADCETVVHSEFSKFFGIPVEILGIGYYVLIALAYVVYVALPGFFIPAVSLVLLAITTGAFLFSLYLTFLQAFTIRQWCTWCLISAGISTIIFILAVLSVSGGIVDVLASNKEIVVGIHLLGFAIGIGGATMADILFARFLKDFEISGKESEVLHLTSQVIWVALAIIVVSGVGLFVPESARLMESSKFLVKVTAVAILIVNGAFLNLYISPRLVKLCFGKDHYPGSTNVPRLRKIAFALGAISFTSWYTAAILGMVKSVPLPYWQLLSVYLGIVITAIIGSQILERTIVKQVGGS